MVNIDEFIKRLEVILDYYSLNASAFADKIGVQRSSLSHLLSGRNKPSLDFILKILEEFPEVDLYWILNGKGKFPKGNEETITAEYKSKIQDTETEEQKDLFSSENIKTTVPLLEKNNTIPFLDSKNSTEPAVEKIVVFYKNGTFKTYRPEL
jgi:transcriptional regulator with XRE-family HTH domain